MFANQNVVTKLRQPFTLQRLNEMFEIDGSGSTFAATKYKRSGAGVEPTERWVAPPHWF